MASCSSTRRRPPTSRRSATRSTRCSGEKAVRCSWRARRASRLRCWRPTRLHQTTEPTRPPPQPRRPGRCSSSPAAARRSRPDRSTRRCTKGSLTYRSRPRMPWRPPTGWWPAQLPRIARVVPSSCEPVTAIGPRWPARPWVDYSEDMPHGSSTLWGSDGSSLPEAILPARSPGGWGFRRCDSPPHSRPVRRGAAWPACTPRWMAASSPSKVARSGKTIFS